MSAQIHRISRNKDIRMMYLNMKLSKSKINRDSKLEVIRVKYPLLTKSTIRRIISDPLYNLRVK